MREIDIAGSHKRSIDLKRAHDGGGLVRGVGESDGLTGSDTVTSFVNQRIFRADLKGFCVVTTQFVGEKR
jgi:hypothetical protein